MGKGSEGDDRVLVKSGDEGGKVVVMGGGGVE